MRYTILILMVITMFSVILAIPAKNDKKQPTCAQECDGDYKPVCAMAKNSSKERLITFGSECVMKNYNCQHQDDEFTVKSDGECGGKVAVRLS